MNDQPIVSRGLVMAISQEPGLETIGEAINGSDAIEKAIRYLPDVVLIVVEHPDFSGLIATKQMLETNPDIRVLALSGHNDDELVFQAIDAGATGYVLKSSSLEEIFESIRAVHTGEVVISPTIAKSLVRGVHSRSNEGPGPDVLSKRELEVLKLTSDGSTAQMVGEKLELSTNTIRTYHRRIKRKLDLHSQNDLFKYAVRNKLIKVV